MIPIKPQLECGLHLNDVTLFVLLTFFVFVGYSHKIVDINLCDSTSHNNN